jgi:hypothetical protein
MLLLSRHVKKISGAQSYRCQARENLAAPPARRSNYKVDEQLRLLEVRKSEQDNAGTRVYDRLCGGRPGKFLSRKIKPPKQPNTIVALRFPNTKTPTYTSNSREMANIMREYHGKLQKEAIHESGDQLVNEMEAYLDKLDLTKLPPNTIGQLSEPIRQDKIAEAIIKSNRKPTRCRYLMEYRIASGKKLLMEQRKDKSSGKEISFNNILETLERIFRDIFDSGVIHDSSFAVGWMCSIPKKGDMREPKNYRPITCLNTEYKLLTKNNLRQTSRTYKRKPILYRVDRSWTKQTSSKQLLVMQKLKK